MEKYRYTEKNKEEAIKKATIELQETEENLIIKEIEVKTGLFSKKVEIEVIEKREFNKYIKEILIKLLKDLGFDANIEMQLKEEIPNYIIYSDNDSLLIGKNGKNLNALSIIINQIIKKEIDRPYKILIDVSNYKKNHQKQIEILAKKLAREVAKTKVEVKMDSMNSYERRIVHNVLGDSKSVYTESIGEEPDRCVVIKPRD